MIVSMQHKIVELTKARTQKQSAFCTESSEDHYLLYGLIACRDSMLQETFEDVCVAEKAG